MTTSGGWEPNLRYPDASVQILDPSFAKYRVALASVERLATGPQFRNANFEIRILDLLLNVRHLFGAEPFQERPRGRGVEARVGGLDAQKEPVPRRQGEAGRVEER